MDNLLATPRHVAGLSDLTDRYRVLLCDVWGVLHNGVVSHKPAVDALIQHRAAGGIVLLISNAPRPGAAVDKQLLGFDVDLGCRDGIITSGDAAKAFLAERSGASVYHLGPDWDHFIYEGTSVDLVDLDDAELVSCVGFIDDATETVDDYSALLGAMVARGLPMLCANPDLVVERGDRLVPCAGALAARYEELGGTAIIVGKPHQPIYEQALAEIRQLAGADTRRSDILAIGDGIGTDMVGATAFGLDALFIASGIHASETTDHQTSATEAVSELLGGHNARAIGFMPQLKW